MVSRSAQVAAQISAWVFFGIMACTTAHADKPSGVGKGKGAGHAQEAGKRSHAQFNTDDRIIVREYYVEDFGRGSCPPGLAKKRNGCMPPGQARKWKVGQPLPKDVVVYDLPRELVVRIGLPPPDHKYVRVASDILLIAVGTGMVVDAINDLGRM